MSLTGDKYHRLNSVGICEDCGEGWVYVKNNPSCRPKAMSDQEIKPCPCGGKMEHFIYDYTADPWCKSPDWKIGIPTWKHGVACTSDSCILSITIGYAGGGVRVEDIERHNTLEWNRFIESTRPSPDSELRELLGGLLDKARHGRSRARGHNCEGTAACQSIIDKITATLNKV